MSWPTDTTPSFYIHDRQCDRCGESFKGFSSSKYCSPECQKMFLRAKKMRQWGVPDDIVQELCMRNEQ